jgi:hypothetical protein
VDHTSRWKVCHVTFSTRNAIVFGVCCQNESVCMSMFKNLRACCSCSLRELRSTWLTEWSPPCTVYLVSHAYSCTRSYHPMYEASIDAVMVRNFEYMCAAAQKQNLHKFVVRDALRLCRGTRFPFLVAVSKRVVSATSMKKLRIARFLNSCFDLLWMRCV